MALSIQTLFSLAYYTDTKYSTEKTLSLGTTKQYITLLKIYKEMRRCTEILISH